MSGFKFQLKKRQSDIEHTAKEFEGKEVENYFDIELKVGTDANGDIKSNGELKTKGEKESGARAKYIQNGELNEGYVSERL